MKKQLPEINYLDFLIPMGHSPKRQGGCKEPDKLSDKDKQAKKRVHR